FICFPHRQHYRGRGWESHHDGNHNECENDYKKQDYDRSDPLDTSKKKRVDLMVYTTGGLMRINEMLPTLPPSEKKIASYILENPQEVISMTANELGKRSSTSGAAVIRLCKSLNLKGFSDLKIRVAGDLQKTTPNGFRDIEPNESAFSIIDKTTNNSIQTIRETAELLSIDSLQKAVTALKDA